METTGMDRARRIIAGARREYASRAPNLDPGGYEPVLARHIAAALEEVEGVPDRTLPVHFPYAPGPPTDEDEKADEEQGDAEDAITVAKDTRRLVRQIVAVLVEEDEKVDAEEADERRRAEGREVLAAHVESIGRAVDAGFLRGHGSEIVPWEVRFAELVGERVELREQVDELLTANKLEIQKRRHAEVRRDDWESAHQAQKEIAVQAASDLARKVEDSERDAVTACDLFDKQYEVLSRYRVALMACRDHTGPVDEIVAEALK